MTKENAVVVWGFRLSLLCPYVGTCRYASFSDVIYQSKVRLHPSKCLEDFKKWIEIYQVCPNCHRKISLKTAVKCVNPCQIDKLSTVDPDLNDGVWIRPYYYMIQPFGKNGRFKLYRFT
jgi:hypothetical protein